VDHKGLLRTDMEREGFEPTMQKPSVSVRSSPQPFHRDAVRQARYIAKYRMIAGDGTNWLQQLEPFVITLEHYPA